MPVPVSARSGPAYEDPPPTRQDGAQVAPRQLPSPADPTSDGESFFAPLVPPSPTSLHLAAGWQPAWCAAMVPAAVWSWRVSWSQAMRVPEGARRQAEAHLAHAARGAHACLARGPAQASEAPRLLGLIAAGVDPTEECCAADSLGTEGAGLAQGGSATAALTLAAGEWFSPLRVAVLAADVEAVAVFLPCLGGRGALAHFDPLLFDSDLLMLQLAAAEGVPPQVRDNVAQVHRHLVQQCAAHLARAVDERHRLVAHLARQHDRDMLAWMVTQMAQGPPARVRRRVGRRDRQGQTLRDILLAWFPDRALLAALAGLSGDSAPAALPAAES